jgi:hypothetical protein
MVGTLLAIKSRVEGVSDIMVHVEPVGDSRSTEAVPKLKFWNSFLRFNEKTDRTSV